MSMSSEFVGKRVLVTGGASGLGKAVVQKFYENGATVFALDCNEEGLKQLKAEFPNVTPILTDLNDWHASRKAVESILPVHHLVNNAGIYRITTVLDTSSEEIDLIMSVNFKAAFNLTQAFAKGIIDHKLSGGTIVNVGSIADHTAMEGSAAYACSKAALKMLTKSAAQEFGKYSIRVNCIRPAGMPTPMYREAAEKNPEFFKRVAECLNRTPLKTEVLISDPANLVYFLSSTQSSVITGEDIAIDGGFGIA